MTHLDQFPVNSRAFPRQKDAVLSGQSLAGKTSMFDSPKPRTSRPRIAEFFDVAQAGFRMETFVMLVAPAPSSITASSVSGCRVCLGVPTESHGAHGSIYTDSLLIP